MTALAYMERDSDWLSSLVSVQLSADSFQLLQGITAQRAGSREVRKTSFVLILWSLLTADG